MVYLLKRLLSLLLTLQLASLIIFVLVEVLPGDPAAYMLGINAEPDTLEALRRELGLELSGYQRYLRWFTGILRGDFGISYTYRSAAGAIIAERLAVSLPLAIYAFLLTLLLAFPLGIISASRYRSIVDRIISAVFHLGVALPYFCLAILLILVFAVNLHWLPSGGFPGWEQGLWLGLRALTLPALAIALPQSLILARILRRSLLDVARLDFMRSARAKGLSRQQAIISHGLANALIPVLTLLGLQFALLLSGTIIIENIFYLPGLGRLIFQAVSQRDLIVVEGVTILLVFAVITVNFLIEMLYFLIDPRLRRQY